MSFLYILVGLVIFFLTAYLKDWLNKDKDDDDLTDNDEGLLDDEIEYDG